MFGLGGRVALVTGGATGIGFSIAKGLAASGAAVVIASRKVDRLQAAVQEIVAETGNERVAYFQMDLARREDSEGIVEKVVAKFDRLDILIGNGALDMFAPLATYEDAIIDEMLEANLMSNIVMTRSAIPELKKHGCGRVVFITSIAGETGSEYGLTAYGATKAGLHGFTRVAAFELGHDGITVNCVAPGFTLTVMMNELLSKMGEAGDREKEIMAKTTALNRMGVPEDVVGPVLMLVSDAGRFMTGTVLVVDGGTSIRMR